jgi:hypothetical protein
VHSGDIDGVQGKPQVNPCCVSMSERSLAVAESPNMLSHLLRNPESGVGFLPAAVRSDGTLPLRDQPVEISHDSWLFGCDVSHVGPVVATIEKLESNVFSI